MYLKTIASVIYKGSDSANYHSRLCLFIKEIDSIDRDSVRIDFFYESRKMQEIEHIDGGLAEIETYKFECADFTIKTLNEINAFEETEQNPTPDNLSEEEIMQYKAYLLMRIEMYNKLLMSNPELTIEQIQLNF